MIKEKNVWQTSMNQYKYVKRDEMIAEVFEENVI